MGNYKDLEVWKLAHDITLDIYKITRQFPDNEKYSLISQLRRAASSIPTNITEGSGQLSRLNYIRFLGISRGSAFEVEYHLLLSKDLGYLNADDYNKLNNKNIRIIKMLNGLIKSLKSSTT